MTKFHFLQFQKRPKITFWTGKKFKTAKNAISRKKIRFIRFYEFFCLDFFKFSGPLWRAKHYTSSIAQIDLKSSLKPNLSNGILDVDFVHISINVTKFFLKFPWKFNTHTHNDWSNLSRSDSIIDWRQVIFKRFIH